MRIFRLGMAASFVVALTACPPADRPVDDPTLDPAMPAVEAPATTAEIPATAQQANLEAATGFNVSGEVHAVPHDNSTEIWVTVRNALPDASHAVHVMSGSCENPGVELAGIDALRADAAGTAQSRTEVRHAPHQIMDGNHIVAVYAPDANIEVDRPIACATLPQHGTARM